MKLEKTHIDIIKLKFNSLTGKSDLIVLLNFVNEILYGENYNPITERGYDYYSNPSICKKRYDSFSIKKKSGGLRTINAPVNGLKNILRPLNIVLNCIYKPHEKATGFVPGKSIVDNAKIHVGKNYVYNIDLKDFFHSFDRNKVKMGFFYNLFNLNKNLEKLAFSLASLCTHPFEIEGEVVTVLPQGAPTSPVITNILCYNLDRRLNGLAKRFKINYSRYADDISFSSDTNIFRKEEFLIELFRIIEKDQNLVLNPKKTRLQQAGFRQEVTGLVVNKAINVNSRYIKQLRMWLFYWEKYGYEKAESIFIRDYGIEKGHVKNENPSFKNVLSGKLEYLKMVKGFDNSTYLSLNNRFEKLTGTTSKLEKTLREWEQNGIESAIEKYNESNKRSLKYTVVKNVI